MDMPTNRSYLASSLLDMIILLILRFFIILLLIILPCIITVFSVIGYRGEEAVASAGYNEMMLVLSNNVFLKICILFASAFSCFLAPKLLSMLQTEKRPKVKLEKTDKSALLILKGITIGTVASVPAILLCFVMGKSSLNFTGIGLSNIIQDIFIILGVVFICVCEEYFYRAFIPSLFSEANNQGRIIRYIASSVPFALTVCIQSGFGMIFFDIFLISLLLFHCYEHYGTILIGAGIRATYVSVSFVLLGIPALGFYPSFSFISDYNFYTETQSCGFIGNLWITGFLFLVACITVSVKFIRNKNNIQSA